MHVLLCTYTSLYFTTHNYFVLIKDDKNEIYIFIFYGIHIPNLVFNLTIWQLFICQIFTIMPTLNTYYKFRLKIFFLLEKLILK